MPARKSAPRGGFYQQVLDADRRAVLAAALRVEGIDEDIALLRSLVRTELTESVVDRTFVHRSVGLLIKAHQVRARIAAGRGNGDDLIESVKAVLSDVGDLLSPPEQHPLD